MKCIAGHTVDETLLSDGVIIDVGCRDFVFADAFPDKKVYCIDPDESVFSGVQNNFIKMNVAISDKNGDDHIYLNGEGTCLKEYDPNSNHLFNECKTITMDKLYEETGTNVDILKLDCEGAEYTILGESFKPIPKQITVEFHHHCVPEIHDRYIREILCRLEENYEAINLKWETMHGAGFNYWDVLFIRKP